MIKIYAGTFNDGCLWMVLPNKEVVVVFADGSTEKSGFSIFEDFEDLEGIFYEYIGSL